MKAFIIVAVATMTLVGSTRIASAQYDAVIPIQRNYRGELSCPAGGSTADIQDSKQTNIGAAIMRSDGTLLVIAPSRDGLVFASDTRLTVDDGVYCDGHVKILEPSRPKRLLLAVTGRRGFHPVSRMFAKDICEFVRVTPREFDFGLVAKGYIESFDDTIDLKTFDVLALGNHTAAALQQYFSLQPIYQPRNDSDAFKANIVLASYDPEKQIAVVRTVVLRIDTQRIVVETGLNEHYGVDAEAGPVLVGERDYVFTHVLPDIGNFSIAETTRAALGSFPKVALKHVGETPLNEAIMLAVDLINATSKQAETIRPPSGIGGGVDFRIIR